MTFLNFESTRNVRSSLPCLLGMSLVRWELLWAASSTLLHLLNICARLELLRSVRPHFTGSAAIASPMGNWDGDIRPPKTLWFRSTRGSVGSPNTEKALVPSSAFITTLSRPTLTHVKNAGSHLENWTHCCCPNAVKWERWVGTDGNFEEEKQWQRRWKPTLQAKPQGLVRKAAGSIPS